MRKHRYSENPNKFGPNVLFFTGQDNSEDMRDEYKKRTIYGMWFIQLLEPGTWMNGVCGKYKYFRVTYVKVIPWDNADRVYLSIGFIP